MDIYEGRPLWRELAPLEEPRTGRALNVCGFVFDDSFDTFLRNISEDYLRTGWMRLSAVLKEYKVVAEDLSWGWMHPGETGCFPATRIPWEEHSPADFIGWTSCDLSDMSGRRENQLDQALRGELPALRCTCTWRSIKWRIAPDDFAMALKLIEAICPDEPSDWHPGIVLSDGGDWDHVWRRVAQAIHDERRDVLETALTEAKAIYTPLGYRIIVQGYGRILDSFPENAASVLRSAVQSLNDEASPL